MADRALILMAVAVLTAAFAGVYSVVRRRQRAAPERLDMDEFGLELIEGCCAFVVFTTRSCRPCTAVLRVVRSATEGREPTTEIVTVDAVERAELALRYAVRTVPTTFLITAGGRVVKRWIDVPARGDVEHAVGETIGAAA